jgi:hypothetical protein
VWFYTWFIALPEVVKLSLCLAYNRIPKNPSFRIAQYTKRILIRLLMHHSKKTRLDASIFIDDEASEEDSGEQEDEDEDEDDEDFSKFSVACSNYNTYP